MKTKEIRDLIDFISATGLEEVDIETEGLKIRVKRSPEANTVTVAAPAASTPSPAPAPVVTEEAASAPPASSSPSSNQLTIKSPMIGTFYLSPNPDSEAFVQVGDTISAGDTVCIIEAMKLFNEIESDVAGRIVEILVDNATPVEFDQPLFVVEPA